MSSQFKTVAVVGSGALGLYYGARLARAGVDVTFLARSDLGVLRTKGITVKAPDGDFVLSPVKTAAKPEEIGAVDLVLITLKATANDQLVHLLPPLMHAGTVVVNLQNGIGVDESIAVVAGAERTVGGLCFVCVNRLEPGVAECTMTGQIVLGEVSGPAQKRTRALADLLSGAGIKANVNDRLEEVRWRKLVWNVPFNGLAVTGGGITTEDILRSPELEAEAWALMLEVQRAAAAYDVKIPDEFVIDNLEKTRPMGPYKTSTMLDYLAGKPLEVEPIWGEPLRRAKAKNVSVPKLEALYRRLVEMSAKG